MLLDAGDGSRTAGRGCYRGRGKRPCGAGASFDRADDDRYDGQGHTTRVHYTGPAGAITAARDSAQLVIALASGP
jgi:hypothetical protein